MNIIIPQSGRLFAPRRSLVHGGLNILNRQWRDLLLPGPRSGLRGRIKVDILDARTKRVIRPGRWQHNLILDSGLNMPFSYLYADCFLYGHLSTDAASPVSTDAAMVGWVKQTNTYGSGDGGYSISGDVITLTRSFVFTAETSTVTYTKFYSSHASGSSAIPFNEVLLAESITLSADQQAKVTMSLEITMTPHTTAATYSNEVINGVSGSTGSGRIPALRGYINSMPNFSYPYSTGATYSGFNTLEPTTYGNPYYGYVSPQSSLEASTDIETTTLRGTVTISSTVGTISTYTSGSHSRVKSFLMDLSDCNVSGIQSIGFLSNTSGWKAVAFQFLSATAFTKLNTQKLSMNYTFSIGRSD